MRGYQIYTTKGESRGRVYPITPNLNCITGLYQNAVAFPFSIGSSETVQLNLSVKMAVTRTPPPSVDFECAVAICIKWRSITAVVLNNSFILRTARRMEKTIAVTRNYV